MTTPPSLEVFGQTMRNQIERVGQSFTAPDEDWISILHVETAEREHLIMAITGDAYANDFTKDMLANYMRDVIVDAQAIHYGLLINTWAVETTDLSLSHMPSEHPDRYEQLVVMFADRHADEMWTARITRHENAPPTLEPWEKFPSDGSYYFGRFANLRESLRESE